jgi:DNA (cytosine-5)-methyltransferase 1
MSESTTMVSKRRSSPTYSMGELFCGAGGLSRGFHNKGFEPRFANDIWDVALHTFLMNFDPIYAASWGNRNGDILALPGSIEDISVEKLRGSLGRRDGRESPAGELDLLLGGPPCQGYSVNSHIRSADDPRNHLFKHYVRLLRGLSPKVFVLENVPGMLSLEGGRFFDELLSEISSSGTDDHPGYDVEFKILNAAHYGVPQERFRIVVVGTRRDVSDRAGRVVLPAPIHYSLAQAHFKGGRAHTFHYAIGHRGRGGDEVIPRIGTSLLAPVSVSEAISDLPALTNGGGEDFSTYIGAAAEQTQYQRTMRQDSSVLANHWCRALFYPNTERVKHIPAGGDWRSIPRDLLPPGMQRALRKDHTTRYGRLPAGSLSGTILTKPDPHWGTFIHFDEDQQRLISVREAARLQSFPDRHVFYGGQVDQYRLCGNAVPPLMAEAIAENVKLVLDRFYGQSREPSKVEATASGWA